MTNTKRKLPYYLLLFFICQCLFLKVNRSQGITCLSVPNYPITTWNCPENFTLPGVSYLVSYYDGNNVIFPSGAPAITDGDLLVDEGRIGSVRSGLIADVNIMNSVNGNSFSLAMFVKQSNIFSNGLPISLVNIQLSFSYNMYIVFGQSATDSSSIDVSVIFNSTSSSNSVEATGYFGPNSNQFLNNWNHIIVSRDGLTISIAVNGVQQPILWNGNSTLLSQSFDILVTGHEIGCNCNGTLVDELGIFNPALSLLNQATMFRVYDSNCAAWQLTGGAPIPFFNAWYQNAAIMISVSFVKSYTETVFYRLNTNSSDEFVCIDGYNITSDVIVPSAGVAWTVDDSNSCVKTFTLEQTPNNIYNTSAPNNNWVIQLSANGNQIEDSLELYSTYSVNNEGNCETVTYQVTVQFDFILQAYSDTDFTSIGNLFQFPVDMVYVDSNGNLVIEGTLYGLLPGASFLDITLVKLSSMATFVASSTVCEPLTSTETAECVLSFSKPWVAVNDGQENVSGDDYNLEVAVYQGSVFSRHANLQFGINYVVAANPNIIESDSVITSISFYNSDYSKIDTLPYTSNDTIYLENSLEKSANALPSYYSMTLNQGYLCCVPSSEVIPSYNPQTGTGGCAIPTPQMTQFAVLGALPNAVTIIPAGAAPDNGEYRLAIQLSKILQPFTETQICAILLTSRFIQASNGRRLLLDSRKIAKALSSAPWTQIYPYSIAFFDLYNSTNFNANGTQYNLEASKLSNAAKAGIIGGVVGGVSLVIIIIATIAGTLVIAHLYWKYAKSKL